MRRKTKWILGLGIGVPVLLIGVGLLALRLTSSSPEQELASIEIKKLPELWADDTSTDNDMLSLDQSLDDVSNAQVPDAPVPDTPTVPSAITFPTIENLGLPITGTLVMLNESKPFGEESFELSREDEDVMLRSNGRFWFKAFIATITLKYDQILRMDSYLRPTSLASSFDAPLGMSRELQADFADDNAIVRSGRNVDEFSVDLDRAYVLGTFSTYAIIPLLFELRQLEGRARFETLIFAGPPNQDAESQKTGFPETIITQLDDIEISFGGQRLSVSQYEISGNMGTMRLYARGTEMLGLLAGSAEESLFVYRADYFEDGFRVIEP